MVKFKILMFSKALRWADMLENKITTERHFLEDKAFSLLRCQGAL